MSRFILITSLLCLSLTTAIAQKTTITGTIADDGDLPLPGATVMLLNPVDSTLQYFASTDAEGRFTFKQIPRAAYVLNVNFLGMAPVFQPVEAADAETQDLGRIGMVSASKLLSEVQVTADYVPIEITKDTITYNPDAFKTQPNAVVEDLLKKLPGIEVGADGSIKAQGEEVRNIFVDGKEFFGNDPKMATKNLPAKALKKVKVYDKKSEMSEFTGVDDGEREKTIDLQLREEFKKGLFGTAELGYGSDERYRGKAAINRFSQTTQLSFLGQLNNVNEQGFSFTDRMNFSGGMRGMSGGRGGVREISITSEIPFEDGPGNGLVNTGAAGLNFNFQKSKKFNVRTSYFFNNVERNLLQESIRQTLFPNPFDTEQETRGDSRNTSHSFALNSDLQLDSFQQVQVSARVSAGDGSAINDVQLQNFLSGGVLENASATLTDNRSDNLSINTGLSYMTRFGRTGRNASISGNFNQNNQDTESLLNALNEYFSTGETELLDQFRYTDNRTRTWDGTATYTEPLRRRRYLELNYQVYQSQSDYDQTVSDFVEDVPVINPMLSNAFSSQFTYHRPGATFRYGGEVHNINLGAAYQLSELTGLVTGADDEIRQSYKHVLPRAIWRWNIGNGKSMRFSYTTRVSPPSITQLSPVIDNSDPLRIYTGNPNLDAEYSHNVNINFHSFSQFSNTSFFTSLGTSVTNDRIITSRNIDEQFREVSSPINIDRETRVNGFISYGRPFKLIHSRVTVDGNLTYTRSQNVINFNLLDINRWARTAGLSVSNLNSDVLEYRLGTSWTFTDSYYPDDENLDQHTIRQNYYVDINLTVWKKWVLAGNYSYNLYTSDQFAENQALPLMEFSLSRFVLPGDKGQLKLSVFDVLDENRGLSRNANVNYLEEIRSNSIGRYAMLSFIYSLRGAGDAPPGAFRGFSRRR